MRNKKENPNVPPPFGFQGHESDTRGILPHYLEEYERSVLGYVLESGKMPDGQLEPGDFYSTKHRVIFSAMLEMARNNVPVDDLTVREHLEKKGELERCGGFAYIGSLSDFTISANIGYHIEQVKEASYKRRLWEKAVRLSQVIENGSDLEAIEKLTNEFTELGTINARTSNLISLAGYDPKPMTWLLKGAIPDRYPSIIYGDGGLGKSFLGVYFAILAAMGKQTFLGLEFPESPLKVLYTDWELDIDETTRRALKIAKGLGLSKLPINFNYYSPDKSLYKLLPELKGLITARGIQLIVIDSLGASCVDPEDVGDIVKVFTQIKGLEIATLILDHQSKLQSQENYNTKTPYGSVYKYNLSRSVFQLSCIGRDKNQVSLMLRHKKSNFSRLLDDLKFDISFEGDTVLFLESMASTPEERELLLIHETQVELEGKGEDVNQKNIILQLKGILGKDKVIRLLKEGEGKLWDKKPGDRKEILYKSKILKSGYIYAEF